MKADHEPGGAPEIARECAFPGDGRRHACNRRSSTVLEWGPCCYCGLPIRATEIDPCRLRVETAEGKWQVWFCHSACVKERLPDRPELMGLFSPAHFTTPSPHLIAILMSPEGRFLQCRNCQLSFTFPNGAQFGVIAKQFGSYLCSSPMRIPARRLIAASSSSRYEGRVPAMASCAKCERKFFTPATFARDSVGAEEYLGQKFDVHECE